MKQRTSHQFNGRTKSRIRGIYLQLLFFPALFFIPTLVQIHKLEDISNELPHAGVEQQLGGSLRAEEQERKRRKVEEMQAQLDRRNEEKLQINGMAGVTIIHGGQDKNLRLLNEWQKNLHVFEAIPVDPSVCPGEIERIGKGDGSKVICNVDGLAAMNGECVVHSYGVNEQIQFDLELKRRANCRESHAFDINPTYRTRIGTELRLAGIDFHLYGISDREFTEPVNGESVPLKRFQTIMKELGHTRLDILKMDVEGAEYQSLLLLAESPACRELPATLQQILIELHVWLEKDVPHLPRLLTALQDNCGFKAFAKEPNPLFDQQCWEVSFYREPGTEKYDPH